jgi:Protein of unknown function (DUF1638)
MTIEPPSAGVPQPMVMVGCGILQKEVEALIRKNGWNVETHFIESALHNYFGRLWAELDTALTAEERKGKETIVFYGACHPLMDRMLEEHRTLRTCGQNCIVMLLGYERFMAELSRGAYFLLEDWALKWEPMLTELFGSNRTVLREIFHSSHKMIIAIRTPCSGDFTTAAEAAARHVDLPLEWMDVDLTHLESVLADAIERKIQNTE